jgi:hypothetical protein
MSTNAELNTKILDFAQVAAEVGAGARKLAEDGLTACKEARPLVEKLADELVQDSHVEDSERDEAVKLASTHSGALKLASNLISCMREEKAASAKRESKIRLGRGVPDSGQEKSASDSQDSPFVGRRAGLNEKRASDVALLKGLGIDPRNVTGS